MTKLGAVLRSTLPAAIMFAGFCYFGQPATAQDPKPGNAPSAQEQPAPPPASPKPALDTKTFSGKIVKSGDVLVLFVAETNTNYKLDDQQKAKEFVNQNVKITGVLDDSTGVIRVTTIEPV